MSAVEVDADFEAIDDDDQTLAFFHLLAGYENYICVNFKCDLVKWIRNAQQLKT